MRKYRGYWNYETVKEESKRYNTKSEFRKCSYTAFKIAEKNKWLDDFSWLLKQRKPKGYWNIYEHCCEESKKYKSRYEFEKGKQKVYQIARVNGWLDKFTWLKRKKNPYNTKLDNVYVYIFEQQHSVYVGRTIDFKRRIIEHQRKGSVYNFSKTNNIPIPSMTILESGLTLEQGLEREDYYVNKYREEGWNILNKAKTGIGRGSLGLCSKKWTKQKVFEEAKKYTSRGEFSKKNDTAYRIALKKKWIDVFFPNILRKPRNYWTYDKCLVESKKYKKRNDFQKGCSTAYHVARKKNWLNIFFPKRNNETIEK